MIAIMRLARDKENPTLAINLTFGKCSFIILKINYYFLFINQSMNIYQIELCFSSFYTISVIYF
jgi:hypothetical protein